MTNNYIVIMGIRKLNTFLTTMNAIIFYNNIHEFVDKIKINNNAKNGKIIIGIDFWLFVHKFLHSDKSSSVVLGFLNQIIKLLLNNMIPLYVVDGTIPIEKIEQYNTRKK